MGAVGQVGVELVGPREPVEHVGEVAAGLLVLPLAGEEHRHLDAVDQRGRADRAEAGLVVVGLGLEAAHEVQVLGAQALIGVAVGVALVDLLVDVVGAVGARVVADVAGPLGRESTVEDPAGVPDAGVGLVDYRHRADGGQVGRLGGGHEELGDAGVGDPDHPDLAIGHPVLSGDGLDGVVAVGHLGTLEERQGPARAAGTPQVHPYGGVAQGIGQLQLGGWAGGVGRRVARHGDHGGIRAVGGDVVAWERREADHGGQGRAVPHLEVVDALDQFLALEQGGRGRLVAGQDVDRLADLEVGALAGHHAVTLTGRHPTEGQQSLVVDRARGGPGPEGGEPGLDGLPVAVDQPRARSRARRPPTMTYSTPGCRSTSRVAASSKETASGADPESPDEQAARKRRVAASGARTARRVGTAGA